MATEKTSYVNSRKFANRGRTIVFLITLLIILIGVGVFGWFKLTDKINALNQLCENNDLMYQALYDEYSQVYEEKKELEQRYEELYEYVYSNG